MIILEAKINNINKNYLLIQLQNNKTESVLRIFIRLAQMKKRIYKLNNKEIRLGENEAHIWNFDLNKYLNLIDKFKSILSREELIRADKFYFDRDKNWFIINRGLLRNFVSIYTSIPAKEIKFVFNNFGKPSLAIDGNSTHLHFNLSHSKNFLSIGFIINSQIGIDIELMNLSKDHLRIAKRFFSNSEFDKLLSFPADKLRDGFYSCWTAKEAVIKLFGMGLSFSLKDFDVELKELKPDESYKYKVNLKKQSADLFIEVFKLSNAIYGACAVDNEKAEFIHCYFEDENAITDLFA